MFRDLGFGGLGFTDLGVGVLGSRAWTCLGIWVWGFRALGLHRFWEFSRHMEPRGWTYIIEVPALFKASSTHRLHSSSFLGLPYRILHINPQKRNYLGAHAYRVSP